jgi:hypothetical protein
MPQFIVRHIRECVPDNIDRGINIHRCGNGCFIGVNLTGIIEIKILVSRGAFYKIISK